MFTNKKRFQMMAMGGTFDHFHAGHESFIQFAAKLSYKLLIGITADELVHTKEQSASLQPYKIRHKAVQNFCETNKLDCELVKLTDIYGPTIDREYTKIDSLCATKDTEGGADKINEVRQAMGMRPLPIFLAPLLNDQTNTPIRSTKIRAGLIDRHGKYFVQAFHAGLEINAKQRQYLSRPLGPIVTEANPNDTRLIAVVGDYALSQFLINNWSYRIGVYDGRTQRQPFVHELIKKITPTLKIANPAGSISAEAFQQLAKLDTTKQQHILVDGEEDLVTTALILTLPLKAILYYGQPGKGMVKLEISEELKEKIWKLLKD